MDFASTTILACSTNADPASPHSLTTEAVVGGVCLAVLAVLLLVRPLRRLGCFVMYGVCLLLLALLLPAVDAAREAARRSSCGCSLTVIGLALQNYADVYGSFPPAYITDGRGNRLHSWRVLILPYLEQKPLYDQYDFSEPWNGPHNRLLVKYMPAAYRCPSDDVARPGETSYAAIEGPGTLLSESEGSRVADIKDGTSTTLAVVEAAGSGINWMEPRDIPFGSLAKGLMSTTKPGMASRHGGACKVVFGDGHTGALNSTTPAKTLQALATRAGGERVDDDY
ncbi:MAG TPA: DUF1559 domain-containing protein [Pirellulales bacterium]|nr:DUF1559 domain-containing protein [Pirellulales bacterium]